MVKRNTIVKVQAYPHTPIGCYVVYHYDIDTRNIKPGKSKYTLHEKHLIAIARHEGKYHAYGKIDEKKYGNFTISENQIVYYDDVNKTEEVLFDICYPYL